MGLRPNGLQRLRRELLARLLGVLRQKRPRFVLGEVPQTQGLGPDVKGAAASDDGLLRRGVDAVVPHIAHAAQNDALRKPRRAAVIAGPELPQNGQQAVPHKGVDFINELH